MAELDIIRNMSNKGLESVPEDTLKLRNLRMLYLECNLLTRLPEDFFQRLPKLYWLDLRGNRLKTLPRGIAHHQYLENLLLKENLIERLPDELGLVPNLKVLQIAGNPIIYPPMEVIERGADDICIFLKQEYFKKSGPAQGVTPVMSLVTDSDTITTTTDNVDEDEVSKDVSFTIEQKPVEVPTIVITGLSKPTERVSKSTSCNFHGDKRVHEVRKKPSKLSVLSHFNSEKYLGSVDMQKHREYATEKQLKELWLGQLRELIKDQEKIIQQEKTLASLYSWRKKRKDETPRSSHLNKISETPYDTDPLYNKLMSREDFTKKVEGLIAAKNCKDCDVDVDKLITDVIAQLKVMANRLETERTPSEKLKCAEEEIQLIVDLHKKISKLQMLNQKY